LPLLSTPLTARERVALPPKPDSTRPRQASSQPSSRAIEQTQAAAVDRETVGGVDNQHVFERRSNAHVHRLDQLDGSGVKNYKDAVDRYEAAQEAIGQSGVSFRDIYWTIGPYDIFGILEAPDDETATAALLTVAGQGTSGQQPCAPSTPAEMRSVIEKAT
jgi:uncharacterized protein with GYD domain